MKCSNCLAEWTLPRIGSFVINKCPFCGNKRISIEPYHSFGTVLHTIYQQLGDIGMRNGNQLVGSFLDLAPTQKKEAKMLVQFVKCHGHTMLLDAKEKDTTEIKAAIERVVFLMTEELLAEQYCRTVCEAFCKALGCGQQIESGFVRTSSINQLLLKDQAELKNGLATEHVVDDDSPGDDENLTDVSISAGLQENAMPKKSDRSKKIKPHATWVCACGFRNSVARSSCECCGEQRKLKTNIKKEEQIVLDKAPKTWVCSCGYRNQAGRTTCENCGKSDSGA